jgi:hypothetical protein
MNNFTNPPMGSMCSGENNFSYLTETPSTSFDTKLPICLHIHAINDLLNVKNDLICFLDNDTPQLQDVADSSITKHIKEFIDRGNVLRDELKSSEKDYLEYREKIKNNLEKINAFLEFVEKLNDIPIDHHKLVKDSVNILLEDMDGKDKLSEIKMKYTDSKEKYMKYLNELLNINELNIGNKCGICFTNIVTSYYNPCGHTICGDCDMFDGNHENMNTKCPICRSDINEKRKLFFI